MNRVFLILLFFLSFFKGNAQYDGQLDFQILQERRDVNIKSSSKAEKIVNSKIRFFRNSSAEHLRYFYDSFQKIKKIQIVVSDTSGNVLQRLNAKDFKDYSGESGFEVRDVRYLYKNLRLSTFPCDVDICHEIETSNLFYVWDWKPVRYLNSSIVQSDLYLRVNTKEDLDIRYRSFFLDDPSIKIEENSKLYHWQLRNYTPKTHEVLSVAAVKSVPTLRFTTTSFKIKRSIGGMGSWEEFGNWCYDLTEGKQNLPKDAVHELVNSYSHLDTLERIKAVYKWVQSRTRYISVQLGIGGWEPIDAALVHKNGYGDCKALVNYTSAALKVVGIRSDYCLIYAGGKNDPVIKDFPNQSFNHVVLSVPLKEDTIWLECTSQKSPFNYLSDWTASRNALIVKKNSSELVRTPKYLSDTFSTTSTFEVIREGKNARANFNFNCKGEAFESFRSWIDYPPAQLKNRIGLIIDLKDPWVSEINVNYTQESPNLSVSGEFTGSGIYRKAGNKMLIDPSLISSQLLEFEVDDDRETVVSIPYNFDQKDTLIFEMPEDYEILKMPNDTVINNDFGFISIEYKVDQNQIHCYFQKGLYKKIHFPLSFNELARFTKASRKLEGRKILLKKI